MNLTPIIRDLGILVNKNDVEIRKFREKHRMNTWSVPKASLLPALLLAALVFFTYSTLQNYGPESTLRKFHQALWSINQSQLNNKGIPKADWETLRSSLQEDIGELDGRAIDPHLTNLITRTMMQFQAGATYSLARMDRQPREVRIAVVYTVRKQPPLSMVWVIDKPIGGREWKISARKTLSAMGVP